MSLARFVRGAAIAFSQAVPGDVRAGVWDRFTSWGVKIKEGDESVFDETTLAQMVSNFGNQRNDIYMDYDHQTVFVQDNGQPAIALAWYSALAAVNEGKVFAFATHDPSVAQPDAADLESGLYGFRSEVTDAGQALLGGGKYKYISPLFDVEGADEQANPLGYVLYCVAATNNPFQDGVPITFSKNRSSVDAAVAAVLMSRSTGATRALGKGKAMDELYKRLGLADDASPDQLKGAMSAYLKKLDDDAAAMKKKYDDDVAAMKKMNDGDIDDDDKKKMADDAEVMADDGDDASAMQKMAKVLGFAGKTTPLKMAAALDAKFIPMGEHAALKARLDKLEQDRAAEKAEEEKSRVERFADEAIADGRWDKEKRANLVKLAKVDFEVAKDSLLPKGTYTATRRFTRGGDPITAKTEPTTDNPDGIDQNELGAELAIKARKYAKDKFGKVDGDSLRKAYIALGKFDNSYAENLARLRGGNFGE